MMMDDGNTIFANQIGYILLFFFPLQNNPSGLFSVASKIFYFSLLFLYLYFLFRSFSPVFDISPSHTESHSWFLPMTEFCTTSFISPWRYPWWLTVALRKCISAWCFRAFLHYTRSISLEEEKKENMRPGPRIFLFSCQFLPLPHDFATVLLHSLLA